MKGVVLARLCLPGSLSPRVGCGVFLTESAGLGGFWAACQSGGLRDGGLLFVSRLHPHYDLNTLFLLILF